MWISSLKGVLAENFVIMISKLTMLYTIIEVKIDLEEVMYKMVEVWWNHPYTVLFRIKFSLE
jgi:hypothetical protein